MPSLPRTPELTSIYMTSGLDVPLESKDWGWLASEQDVAHLGGAWLGGYCRWVLFAPVGKHVACVYWCGHNRQPFELC